MIFALTTPLGRYSQLTENGFTGTFPPQLANLSKLTELSANNNKFDGTIPPVFGTMTALRLFVVHDNFLVGDVTKLHAEDDSCVYGSSDSGENWSVTAVV